jgi:CHAD domain-containing protein
MTAFVGSGMSMATEIKETERKYEAPPGMPLPNLDGLPGVAAESAPEEQRLEARYYDTDDLRLIRDGVTLRRREGGSDPGWRPAGRQAKLQRALATVLPPARRDTGGSRGRLSPRAPAADVILDYAADQVSAIRSLDPMVRRDAPDAVHRMRVATRRLRSTLRSFRNLLRAKDIERLGEELKWLGDLLGAARDAEVLAGHVQDGLDRLPPELVLGPVQARVRAHFAPMGAGARREVIEALDGDRYLALLDALDTLLIDPPVTEAAGKPADEAVPAAVRKAERRLRRRMRRALRTPAGPDRDTALHEARKAAKYVRYAAEAAAPAFGRQATCLAKRVKKLQSALGDHHDGVAARGEVRSLGVHAHLAGENAFSYGILYEQDACQAADLEERASHAWKRATRPGVLRWLG